MLQVHAASTRDHADLLLSSKCWPLVFGVDMACGVVAHIETRDPALANALWGERRGCFEKPSKIVTPKVIERFLFIHFVSFVLFFWIIN